MYSVATEISQKPSSVVIRLVYIFIIVKTSSRKNNGVCIGNCYTSRTHSDVKNIN